MSTALGHAAEAKAADWLKEQGFKLIEKNWQTRFCEIDVIVRKKQTIYFVEVKYRRTSEQGGGLDYITPKKLNQMEFAAKHWVATNQWGGDFVLSALEVSGKNLEVTDFIESL